MEADKVAAEWELNNPPLVAVVAELVS
jgi:hypothetical protein